MNMFLDSILLWPQDCSLQSCCHPRIEGNSTRNSTRAGMRLRENTPQFNFPCYQYTNSLFQAFCAATKKWLVPVSRRA